MRIWASPVSVGTATSVDNVCRARDVEGCVCICATEIYYVIHFNRNMQLNMQLLCVDGNVNGIALTSDLNRPPKCTLALATHLNCNSRRMVVVFYGRSMW